MKKILFFTVMLLSMVSFSVTATTIYQEEPVDESIDLELRPAHKDPRLTSTALFSARRAVVPEVTVLSTGADMLIYTSGYTGTVDVEIDGVFGLTTSFYSSGSANQDVSLDSLVDGETYSIKVYLGDNIAYVDTFVYNEAGSY